METISIRVQRGRGLPERSRQLSETLISYHALLGVTYQVTKLLTRLGMNHLFTLVHLLLEFYGR